jgi:lipopolysaccharide/colanic/teichoic acid biosynthesis glycosyltransferase
MVTIDSHASVRIAASAADYPLKRSLDVLVALTLLIVMFPPLLLIAVAIKLSSKGPVFYRQRRLGLREEPFVILKFRTMCELASESGPAYTVANDARITALGRLLRRTSLDELPQLVNVLCGHMSLIGPRPYAGFELEGWTADQRAIRASVRPGISGLAQANGRSAISVEESRRYDLEYARHCSFWLDCQIAIRTLLTVIAIQGTN